MRTSPAPRFGRRLVPAVLASAVALLGAASPAMAGGTISNPFAGTMTFTANAGENNILSVSVAAPDIVITDTGGAPFSALDVPGCTLSNNDRTAACPATLIANLVLNLGDGNDTTNPFGTWPASKVATINGDDGSDVLDGSPEADVINGGTGNDGISANGGDDTLNGGPGADSLSGGLGTDTVTYAGTAAPVTVTLDSAANDGATGEGDRVGGITDDVENVTGGNGNDTIRGNDDPNVLDGGAAGNDTLDGGPNVAAPVTLVADTLIGGTGSDTASWSSRPAPAVIVATLDGVANDGESGENDVLTTIENLIGGQGDDQLTGDVIANTLDGAGGDDTLNGGPEDDPLESPVGDTFIGGAGTDTVSYADRTGTASQDALTVTLDGAANDGLSGETDNVGGTGNTVENVVGAAAGDTLTGNSAANTLDGGSGNDTLNGLSGADVTVGAGGTDRTTYADRTSSVTITPNDGNANDGNADDGAPSARDDVQTENVTGGSGNDVLTGGSGANGLDGGPGDDLLDGGGGSDTLAGDDGADTATYATRTNPVIVAIDGSTGDGEAGENDNVTLTTENLVGGTAGDTLNGSALANVILGGGGIDTIDGKASDDTIDGGADGDIIDGNVGSDTISYASRSAALTVTLAGGADDGETGEDDSLFNIENAVGGSGSDQLTGDTETNVLTGGAGNDTLNGGLGLNTDTLDGGDGTDTASYAGRTEALSLSLDATANDGSLAENDTLTLIENLVGGDGDDTISGDAVVNDLKGGLGVDSITSRDSVADTVSCGGGTDATVVADLNDVINPDCESVDPGPVPALTIDNVTKAEGDSGTSNAVLTVTATPAPTATITVDYASANGTATQPADYTTAASSLSFAPGETTKTINVPVKGDKLVEGDETLTVALSNATKATLPAGPGTVTITDDDTFPTASIGDVTRGEGATPATFTVTLSKTYPEAVAVNYATSDATASAPGDYTAASGTVSIPAGETTGSFPVALVDDTADEPDETFAVTLSSPVRTTIADGSASGTITDDDPTPTPAVVPVISIGDATVTEGNSATVTSTFAVTLDKATTVPVTVNVATADNTAKAPSDYTPTTGTLTFAPGETSRSVAVLVKGDIADESDETFGVLLSGPTNATLASKSVGVGTIRDDDAVATPARVRPKLGAKVAPTRDRTAPFTYTVSGKLVLPAGTAASAACTTGTVTVTFKVGTRTVKTARGALSSTCAYRVRATFRSAKDVKAIKGKKITARARFGGNTRLLPAAQTFTLRAG